jgi:F0F1-type ATP synthase assembly protein I
MVGDPPPERSGGESAARGSNQGWTAVSYLIGGMVVWGGIGWAVDKWLLHTKGIAFAIGCVLGVAGGIYLTVRRLGDGWKGNGDRPPAGE